MTASRTPPDVRWIDDGFSIELGRLCRPRALQQRTRHVWALTIPLYLLALVIELSVAGSAFVIGTALVLFVRQAMWFDERRLEVRSLELRIGRRRVPARSLLGCDLRGHSLIVRTESGPWPLDVAGLAEPERAWLCEQIEAVRTRWAARTGRVPRAIRDLAASAPKG